MQATQAAVEKLTKNNRPIILIVGGLGKGVDRSPLVQFLSTVPQIKKVFCLGHECLGHECAEFSCYERYPSLNKLVDAIMQIAGQGDQVLFSPSGSSFDLFSNYKERGEAFKREVLEYKYGEREENTRTRVSAP
jgi:UDP-N-acetylmuramoylalanine--D-glutamate ligase